MKRLSVFLALSLSANVALLLMLTMRHAAISHPVPAPTSSATAGAKSAPAIMAALSSGDAAVMRAAGVPEEIVLRLAAARAYAKLRDLDRMGNPRPPAGDKYLRRTPVGFVEHKPTPAERKAGEEAQHEFNAAMRVAFGDDPGVGAEEVDAHFPFLSAATRAKLHQIEQDYDEMREQVSQNVDRIEFTSDAEKLKLLSDQQQRDVLAAMTPEERAQFEWRATNTAENVRNRWGDAIATEDDYRKIFALQKAFETQFPDNAFPDGRVSPEVVHVRETASRQLENDVQAVIGADNYAAFRRANDEDYKTLNAITSRLALPAGTADAAYALRDAYSARSLQVYADASLNAAQCGEQIAALAAQAQSEFAAKLGGEAADAFLKASTGGWFRALKDGQAFTTDRNAAPPDQVFGPYGAPVYVLRLKR